MAQLRNYTSDVRMPEDLREFWDATIGDARAYPLNARFEPVERTFFCSSEKNDSMAALSAQAPTLPIEPVSP